MSVSFRSQFQNQVFIQLLHSYILTKIQGNCVSFPFDIWKMIHFHFCEWLSGEPSLVLY